MDTNAHHLKALFEKPFDFFCRTAIRDMVVRGAPAIAIAAALSLAVEVSNLKDFNGMSNDAASFLGKRLEYLVSRYGYARWKMLNTLVLFSVIRMQVFVAVAQQLLTFLMLLSNLRTSYKRLLPLLQMLAVSFR